jgi:hypothetical protein
MSLINTVFQNGALRCNGIYIGDDTTGSIAVTPGLTGLTFSRFVVRVEFNVTNVPSTFAPVIIGGTSYRWLGFMVFWDTTVGMKYNNGNLVTSTTRFTPGVWHEAMIEYDSLPGVGRAYLDSVRVASESFSLIQGGDRNFGVTDFAAGKTFGGYIRNLRIYSVTPPTSVTEGRTPASLLLAQNYPNPFNPTTSISFALPRRERLSLKVFDVLGREVSTLLEGIYEAGSHDVTWHAHNLPSGTYFYRLQTSASSVTRKLMLLR